MVCPTSRARAAAVLELLLRVSDTRRRNQPTKAKSTSTNLTSCTSTSMSVTRAQEGSLVADAAETDDDEAKKPPKPNIEALVEEEEGLDGGPVNGEGSGVRSVLRREEKAEVASEAVEESMVRFVVDGAEAEGGHGAEREGGDDSGALMCGVRPRTFSKLVSAFDHTPVHDRSRSNPRDLDTMVVARGREETEGGDCVAGDVTYRRSQS